jgi:hypothetical protein
MAKQITPHITQFYDDAEVLAIIEENTNLTQQFSEPDIQNAPVCVVLPIVRRYTEYQTNQLDLDLFIRHPMATELGQLELYRVTDFIRQRVDIAPVLQTAHLIAGVDMQTIADSIRRQIKFLQRPENRDLPLAPAQILNSQQ